MEPNFPASHIPHNVLNPKSPAKKGNLTSVSSNVSLSFFAIPSPRPIQGLPLYGKAGELATNRRENQEISLLCLHLLQASLVYINTLMIQEVLGDEKWLERMTIRDLAALSPLLTQHINPYGRFDLDMNARIPIAEAA